MSIALRWYHWAIVAVLTLRVVFAPGTGAFAWLGAFVAATALVWGLTTLVRWLRASPPDTHVEHHEECA